MKKWMCGLLAAAIGLALAACGSKEPEVKAWTAADGQAIVDSGAFSDELDELDVESACAVYGLDAGQVGADSFIRRSAGATCEEVAVLVFDSQEHAKAAVSVLEDYAENQMEENRDYRPAEILKLENKWLEQRDNTVLLVVANDLKAAQDAVK